MDNPGYFFYRWTAAFFYEGMDFKRLITDPHYIGSLRFAIKEILYNLPLLLPYLVLLLTLIKSKAKKQMILLLIQLF